MALDAKATLLKETLRHSGTFNLVKWKQQSYSISCPSCISSIANCTILQIYREDQTFTLVLAPFVYFPSFQFRFRHLPSFFAINPKAKEWSPIHFRRVFPLSPYKSCLDEVEEGADALLALPQPQLVLLLLPRGQRRCPLSKVVQRALLPHLGQPSRLPSRARAQVYLDRWLLQLRKFVPSLQVPLAFSMRLRRSITVH